MRTPFARTAPHDLTAPTPPLHYGVRMHEDRADLTCAACHLVIAYAIRADHVEADASYYVDAHARFCVAVAGRA